MHHDTGEVATGDMPSYFKSRHAAIKSYLDQAEVDAYVAMIIPWGLPKIPKLAEFEQWVLKLADALELWETGLQEMMMGNQMAQAIVECGLGYLKKLAEGRDTNPHSEVLATMGMYMGRRTAEWTSQ